MTALLTCITRIGSVMRSERNFRGGLLPFHARATDLGDPLLATYRSVQLFFVDFKQGYSRTHYLPKQAFRGIRASLSVTLGWRSILLSDEPSLHSDSGFYGSPLKTLDFDTGSMLLPLLFSYCENDSTNTTGP